MAPRGWRKATMPSKGARIGSGASKGRSKYNAVKTVVDGITFDSKAEARRYGELRFLEKAGEIWDLTIQPVFPLRVVSTTGTVSGAAKALAGTCKDVIGKYYGDFQYHDRTGRVVEDVKGFKTPLYRWKKKHVEAQYGIQIREIR